MESKYNGPTPESLESAGSRAIKHKFQENITANITEKQDFRALAVALFEKGFSPIPVRGKVPVTKDWSNADCEALVRDYRPWQGVGLLTGRNGLAALDIDVHDPDMVDDLCRQAGFLFYSPDAPDIITRTGQPPKTLIPFLCSELERKLTSSKWVDENGVINQVEVLGQGQQFVAYGIHPGTGKPYQWSGDLLQHQLPTASIPLIRSIFAHFSKLAKEKGWQCLTHHENRAKKAISKRVPQNTGDSPSAIYNRSVPLETVLSHYGWKHYQGSYWTRPGKATGVSGSVLGEVLFCFTSSTPLEADSVSDSFEILARYDFSGNKSAAAKAVLQEVAT